MKIMTSEVVTIVILAGLLTALLVGDLAETEEEHQPWADPEAEKELREWNE